jgi:hypothetical protein
MPQGRGASAIACALRHVLRDDDLRFGGIGEVLLGFAAIERRIGAAVADAVISVCRGLVDWTAAGQLRPSTRARAGDLFVKMYELQEEAALGGIDFAAVARVEGKRVFIARHRAAGTALEGAALDALDEMIEWRLGMLAEVTAAELAYQRCHAH